MILLSIIIIIIIIVIISLIGSARGCPVGEGRVTAFWGRGG